MALWTKSQLASCTAYLKTLYGPHFSHLRPNSPKWIQLSRSGTVWDRIYDIRNDAPWKLAQRSLASELHHVDAIRKRGEFRDLTKLGPTLAQGPIRYDNNMLANLAWKSCQIEHNSLSVGISEQIEKRLPNVSSPDLEDIMDVKLPCASDLVSATGARPDQRLELVELRNHLFALKATLHTAYLNQEPSTDNLLHDVKILSQILLRDTPHHHSVMYRKTTIQTKSDLYAVFPYPLEIEANMERWAKWTLNSSEADSVHPLIRAVWMTLYFMSVHPFPDGNGRLSRVLQAVYMARNGLVPVMCTPDLDRAGYIRMVVSARDGRPQEWCEEIVRATCQ